VTAVDRDDEPRSGPLTGVRVLELATVLMGPYAGQILGGLGADVIKVGDGGGDGSRLMGGGPHPQFSGIALNLHANKRSIALDLKIGLGRSAFMRLLAECDVLITNLRPGPLARLQLSYDKVAPLHPRLIYCQAAGFRSESVDADRPAFDDIIQALTGFPALNDEMGTDMHFMPSLIADKVSGMAIANAVLAALVARATTGVGQRVEVPMFDSLLAFNLVEHLARAAVPGQPAGYARVLTTHRGPHRTSDGWIAMMPYTDAHWRALFEAVGSEDKLEQPWHRDHAIRILQADRVYGELAEILTQRSTADWLELCNGLGVPASPVPTLGQIVTDEQWHRGVLVDADHPVVGPYRRIRQPTVFSATPADDHRPAPLVGQDGRQVLGEVGYSEDEIEALLAADALILG
jgi:crotonobetainyl-CoA:carnitine CoA-transferase CaiB-like acyl-CoA transferase